MVYFHIWRKYISHLTTSSCVFHCPWWLSYYYHYSVCGWLHHWFELLVHSFLQIIQITVSKCGLLYLYLNSTSMTVEYFTNYLLVIDNISKMMSEMMEMVISAGTQCVMNKVLIELALTFSSRGSHEVTRWRFLRQSHSPFLEHSLSVAMATSAWPWPIEI